MSRGGFRVSIDFPAEQRQRGLKVFGELRRDGLNAQMEPNTWAFKFGRRVLAPLVLIAVALGLALLVVSLGRMLLGW